MTAFYALQARTSKRASYQRRETVTTLDELDALAARSGTGDTEAFVALYHVLSPRIRGWIRRFGVQGRDVDDLFQQIISRVYHGLASYDPSRGAFLPWAHSVAHNEMRSHVRARRDLHLATPLDIQRCSDWRQGDTGDTRGDVDRVLARDDLRRQLALLTHREAQVVVLRYVVDLSLREAAERLGVTEDAVSQTQRRALAKLRAARWQERARRDSSGPVSRHPCRRRPSVGKGRLRLHVFSMAVRPTRSA